MSGHFVTKTERLIHKHRVVCSLQTTLRIRSDVDTRVNVSEFCRDQAHREKDASSYLRRWFRDRGNSPAVVLARYLTENSFCIFFFIRFCWFINREIESERKVSEEEETARARGTTK